MSEAKKTTVTEKKAKPKKAKPKKVKMVKKVKRAKPVSKMTFVHRNGPTRLKFAMETEGSTIKVEGSGQVNMKRIHTSELGEAIERLQTILQDGLRMQSAREVISFEGIAEAVPPEAPEPPKAVKEEDLTPRQRKLASVVAALFGPQLPREVIVDTDARIAEYSMSFNELARMYETDDEAPQ